MQNKKIDWKIIELMFLFEAASKSKPNIDSIKSDLFALNSLLQRWGEVTHKDSADILQKILELTTSNQQYESIQNERMFYEDYLENPSKYKDIIFILRLFLKKNLYFTTDDASLISSSEGSSIFDQHFARERDPRIIKAKKEQEISKIVISSDKNYQVVQINEILYLESSGNYVIFYLKNGDKHFSSYSLSYYEDLLSETLFFRIHRSYIININAISSVDNGRGGDVHLSNKIKIPIAFRRKPSLLQLLDRKSDE